MKILKTSLWVIISIGCLAFSAKFVAEFYTQKKIDKLAITTASSAVRGSGWYKKLDQMSSQPNQLHLGELLYGNVHAADPENGTYWAAGNYTSEIYKNGWRKMMVEKPSLAYDAIKMFGPSFFKAFESELMVQKQSIIDNWKDGPQRGAVLNKFSSQRYWADQSRMIDQYTKLINELLKLSDSQLNRFIESTDSQLWGGSTATELQTWLYNKRLIGAMPQNYKWGQDRYMGGWSVSWYPLDLLFLTRRVSRDYPNWTPRRFLTEAKFFGAEAKKYMPYQNDGKVLGD